MNNDIEQGRKLQESTNDQEDAKHAKRKNRHHSDKKHRHRKSGKGHGDKETIASKATVQVSNLSTKAKNMDDTMERGGIGTNIYNSSFPQQVPWDNPVEEMQPRHPPVKTFKPVFNKSKSRDSDDLLEPIDEENGTADILAVTTSEASSATRQHPSVTHLSTNENQVLHGTYNVTNGNETQVFPGILSPMPHESVEPLQNPTQTSQSVPRNSKTPLIKFRPLPSSLTKIAELFENKFAMYYVSNKINQTLLFPLYKPFLPLRTMYQTQVLRIPILLLEKMFHCRYPGRVMMVLVMARGGGFLVQ